VILKGPLLSGALAGVISLAAASVPPLWRSPVEADDPAFGIIGPRAWYRGQPFTGTLIERNLHHDLLAKSEYANGEKEGVSLIYHHTGTVVAQAEFHHGQKDGVQDTWYADGKHRSTGHFRAGVAEGVYTEWHPNGNVYRRQKIENGVELENQMFYESGVIYSNYVVRAERTYGVQGEPLCSTVKQEGFK
jgi:antitoxin component YwqK of YwqJK toxin-antitoxin module